MAKEFVWKKKSERDQWIDLKNKLHSYDINDTWKIAFQLFRNRIFNKFIYPIDNLLNINTNSGEGFVIITIHCALIETFAAFKYGKIFNPRYNKINDPIYQYSDSRQIFTDFLHDANIFENHFYTYSGGIKVIDTPFSANDFYSDVRCALMHEGKTRKNWTINVKPNSDFDNFFIKRINGKLKIYRTTLHGALKNYIDNYISNLCLPENIEGRLFFGRKMDHIYSLRRNRLGWW